MSGPNYMRQSGIFNPENTHAAVTLIGCGGIGSFTALALAKLGVAEMTLIDPDTVEDHNLPNQMYAAGDVGRPKVEALLDLCVQHNPVMKIKAAPVSFEDHYAKGSPTGVIISGLDSMKARSDLWQLLVRNMNVPLYIDGRLGGQRVVLFAVRPFEGADRQFYSETLVTDDEAEDDPCTERAIIDVGFVVASMITRAVRRYFTGSEVERVIVHSQEKFNSDAGLRPSVSVSEVL